MAKNTKAKQVCAIANRWSQDQQQAILAVWQYVATKQDLWGAALKKAVFKPRKKAALRWFQFKTDPDVLVETRNIINGIPNATKHCWLGIRTAIWVAKRKGTAHKVSAVLRDIALVIDAGIKAGDPNAERAAGHFVTALRALK